MDTQRVRKPSTGGDMPAKKISRKERLLDTRSLQIDAVAKSAVMNLESFDNGFQLKKFYRQSFRSLRKQGIEHLVIDIRNNGGGKVDNYTALARYLKDSSFRVADTAFALRNNFRGYGRYFQSNSLNWAAMKLFARKRPDGTYHFRYWEKHVFKPRQKHHFDGQVYLVISGPTFSASTLFCNTMKGQSNVTLVGEETGGGAYGNSGLIIPYVTLPNTGIRVRMPLFRVVQFQQAPKTGRGVTPDVFVGPTVDAVTRGKDLKMEMVKNLIRDSRGMAGAKSRATDSLQ
jgi:C-terminal processing protease CtpA/Prc